MSAEHPLRLRRFDRLDSQGGPYWVGMRRPAEAEVGEEFTLEEVTFRYVTKAALLAALENGTAWKEI